MFRVAGNAAPSVPGTCTRRQGDAVQLAAREPRQLSDGLDQGRHHVRGEPATQASTEALFVDLAAIAPNHVADQLLRVRSGPCLLITSALLSDHLSFRGTENSRPGR